MIGTLLLVSGVLAQGGASLQPGAAVPDVALTDMAGKTVHLSDFRGKKVILFTWASW
ncbi:MAG: redoxin domain-containing protein [Armatimonadota bacterium]